MNDDLYLYPGTFVLKNKLGIDDAARLERAERLVTLVRMGEPMAQPPVLTPQGYRSIHRHIFQDVYDWAGRFRTVNLEKDVTKDKTVEFQPGYLVSVHMTRLFGELAGDTYLRGLDQDTFAIQAAAYLADLNQIHPFREGNGRAQRYFLEQLAAQAGHELDRSRIDAKRWIEGSIQSFGQGPRGHHGIMTGVILNAMTQDGDADRGGENGLRESARKRPPRG